jgi:hypothetical protein
VVRIPDGVIERVKEEISVQRLAEARGEIFTRHGARAGYGRCELLIQVIEYYHESLLESPEALDYLKRRGIGSEEAIRTITIGFANLRLSYRLPEKNRVDGAALPRVLMSQVTGCGRGSSLQASR